MAVPLLQQHEQVKQEKHLLTSDKAALEQIIIKKDLMIASLTTHNDSLKAQLAEKERCIAELNRLHKQVQENLEHYRETTREQRMIEEERYRQQLQQAEGTITQLRQEMMVAAKEQSARAHQLNILLQEYDILKKLYEVVMQKLDKLQSEFNQLQKMQGDSEHAANHWQAEHEKALKKINEQNTLFIDTQRQTVVLSQQVTVFEEKLKELTALHEVLSHEKWILIQEKAQLEGMLKQMEKMVNIL